MSAGRPIEYDPEAVLTSAMDVFWTLGYEATSMQDLLHATRLSKSSLYQAFGSKKQLFITCLERYREMTRGNLVRTLEAAESGFRFVRDTFYSALLDCRNEIRRGCLLVNSANELSGGDSEIAREVSTGFRDYERIFLKAIRKGQIDGSIRQFDHQEKVARFLVSTLSGIRTMVKSGASRNSVAGVIEVALGTLE